MTATRRYNYRLRPGKQAEEWLVREAGRSRFVWNQLVAADKKCYADTKKSLTLADTGGLLTALRAEHDWLREGAQIPAQQEVRNYQQARNQAFRQPQRGFPKFKSRHCSLPSLQYTRGAFSVTEDGRLRLVKAPKTVPVVWSRELPNEPSSVRVFQDSLGHWYASFVVSVDEPGLPANDSAIGVDWGVKVVANTTDSEFNLKHNEYGKKAQAKLTRYQRQMSRRRQPKGKAQTKGYVKARKLAAKTHKKVARQRKDAAVKWANKIVETHGKIAVEDFKPKFIAKSRMARKAADGGIAIAKRELISQAERSGRDVVLVNPAFTTQTCCSCGLTKPKQSRLQLNDRIFICECGVKLDRDLNASLVVLRKAFPEHAVGLIRRHVEGVRPAESTDDAGSLSVESPDFSRGE